MTLTFTKMHGLGNDFVMLPHAPADTDPAQLARQLCDRHFGVGADGLIFPAPPTDANAFDVQFVYYNSDGSRAEMCGNGIRCFALYLKTKNLLPAALFERPLRVETPAGLIQPQLNADNTVTVDMGPPILTPATIPFTPATPAEGPLLRTPIPVLNTTVPVTPVSMGNPHAIIFQDELPSSLDPVVFGPAIETHSAFPAKTNVEFVKKVAPNVLNVVVWERGCGFTLACGTGACATAVAAHLAGLTDRQVEIQLPGGSLLIDWNKATGHVMMTGPATVVFEGIWA
jgi:diaminopimelate epimerase